MEDQSKFRIHLIQGSEFLETLAIYRPYIEQSVTSFEYEVPSEQEWHDRIQKNTSEYPWLVITFDHKVVAYAYASKHRSRTAYNWSVESTVYINQNYHGLGLGKILYSTLIDLLRLHGYRHIYAGITLPNDKSVRLHKSMGFYEVGVFKKIGYKFGSWHDAGWFQLHLSDTDTAPETIKSPHEILLDPKFTTIMEKANEDLSLKSPDKNVQK